MPDVGGWFRTARDGAVALPSVNAWGPRPGEFGRVSPDADVRGAAVTGSPLAARYTQAVDRESAYELLQRRAEATARERDAAEAEAIEEAHAVHCAA